MLSNDDIDVLQPDAGLGGSPFDVIRQRENSTGMVGNARSTITFSPRSINEFSFSFKAFNVNLLLEEAGASPVRPAGRPEHTPGADTPRHARTEFVELVGRPGIAGQLLGNWQLSGLLTFQSGIALTPGISLGNRGLATRPDATGISPDGEKTKESWFNTAAFAAPRPGMYGNAGVGHAARTGIRDMGCFALETVPCHRAIAILAARRVLQRAEPYELERRRYQPRQRKLWACHQRSRSPEVATGGSSRLLIYGRTTGSANLEGWALSW